MPLKYWRVRVGEYSLSAIEGTEKDLRIANIFKHPQYQKKRGKKTYTRYDIALIQLKEDAPVNEEFCSPVCLPPQDRAVDYMFNSLSDDELFKLDDCWTIGWGNNLIKDRRIKYKLRQVRGKVHKNSVCSQAYGVKIAPQMLCFGDGSNGPCRRDSGGPLMCRREGRFYLVGVTSFGADKCGMSGYPVVFTRVASMLPWIMDTLHQNNASATSIT